MTKAQIRKEQTEIFRQTLVNKDHEARETESREMSANFVLNRDYFLVKTKVNQETDYFYYYYYYYYYY